jgi:hypothetical protein
LLGEARHAPPGWRGIVIFNLLCLLPLAVLMVLSL